MTDVFSPEKRSEIMSKIKGKNTKPEKIFRSALWRNGARFRIHYGVAGFKIDIAFPKNKLAVFIDGCFWHGCKDHKPLPQTNKKFWKDKIEGNMKRDKKTNSLLKKKGWTVVRIWEHELKDDLESCLEKVMDLVKTQHV